MKSVKTKILVFSFFMIFIVSVSMITIIYINFKGMFVKEMENVLTVQAEETSEYIVGMLEEHMFTLLELANYSTMKTSELEEQLEFLNTQIIYGYLETAIVTLDGVAHYRNGETVDLQDRDYIQTAISGESCYSDVITSRVTFDKVIMVAVPIFDDENEVISVIIGRTDAFFLYELIAKRGYGEQGYAFIINKEGVFIAHDKDEKIQDVDIKTVCQQSEQYEDFYRFYDESLMSKNGSGTYELNGNQIIMGYTEIEENNWKLYVGAYEEDILEPLNEAKELFWVLFLSFTIISISAAMFFAKHFADPIISLSSAFNQAAKGDLTVRINVNRKDEIGRAGDSFNVMMNQLKSLTYYDPLTNLPNLNVFSYDLDTMLKTRTIKEPLTIIMISIDNFSGVNENYGYTKGDQLLLQISHRIKKELVIDCKMYKGKGDEFMVIVENMLVKTVEANIHRIINNLQKDYYVSDNSVKIKVSIGLVGFPDNGLDVEKLLVNVTHAKQQAKLNSSVSYQVYNPKTHQQEKHLLSLEEDIIKGIRENQFHMLYQPLFDTQTGELVDVEALIRWVHPTKGNVYPDQFIEIAERSGLILDIDEWVFKHVCKQQKAWNQKYQVSINVSAKSFEREDYVDFIKKTIQEYDLDPKFIQLELTERVIMESIEVNIKKMRELKEIGIHIALDDFGIGYSSLNYIVRLPLDVIKIDKSFTQQMVQSDEVRTIVATIINMGHSLGMKIIAEGIEFEDELKLLQKQGCDIGQGYLYSKPITTEELERKYT